ncbi:MULTISPECIES: hypothetical protein [unclassified Streptomyces]|uniref:hypothetical protein n=1 Tax=unclassified Streptomyces TaxID=2593676 RepID=UPI0021C8A13F|nr:hypothetical protein [Streptomyces sp. FIT100]UUN28273.1 hypothetical protein KK483_19230 [Streptomyces sp. FIT100]
MIRTSRTRRLVILTASTALAAGGALLPTSAFAASEPTHTVAVEAAVKGDHWRGGHGDGWRHRDNSHGRNGHGRGDGGGRNGGGGKGNIVVIIGDNNTVPINNGTVNTVNED